MQDLPQLQAFAKAASAFVSWAESSDVSRQLAPQVAARLLSALYAEAAILLAGEKLEAVRVIPEVPEKYQVSAEQARALFTAFPAQYYWTSCEPLAAQPDSLACGDLADDLADTYADVKEGLLSYVAGDFSWARKHWIGTYVVHWGSHVACALPALHELAFA